MNCPTCDRPDCPTLTAKHDPTCYPDCPGCWAKADCDQLGVELWRTRAQLAEAVVTAARALLQGPAVIIGELHETSADCETWYDCCHCEEVAVRDALAAYDAATGRK